MSARGAIWQKLHTVPGQGYAMPSGQSRSGAYHGGVSTNWQPSEPEPGPEPAPQWSQPPFAEQSDQPAVYRPSMPSPYPVVQGAVVLPGKELVPPSPAETALRAVARVLPMLLIFGAIFGPVPWWIAIVGMILGSSVLNQVARDMKRRRIAAAQQQRILPPNDEDLQ